MRTIVYLTAAVLLLNAAPVLAHCGICPLSGAKGSDKGSMSENWMEKKMEKMTSELGLSEKQAEQIEALMTEKMEKKRVIKAEKYKAIKAVKEEYSEKIKTVLNDEQKAKYDAIKAESHKGSMKCNWHDHEHKGSRHDMKGSGTREQKGS